MSRHGSPTSHTTRATASGPGVRPSVVLITVNYPYVGDGGEVMFVAPEVERLAREDSFDLCVVPLQDDGPALEVPPGVTVDRSLARALKLEAGRALRLAWQWPGFIVEGLRAMARGGSLGRRRVWRWAAEARVVFHWARERFPRGVPVLFYTYWRGSATLGVARLAARRPEAAAITRVHNHDLYESRFWPPFQPWVSLYRQVDAVVPVSAHGQAHLATHGVEPARLRLHRLGIDDAVPSAGPSRDGVLRIVSCSFVMRWKRVPRIAAALVALARRHAGRTVRWTHFGDGPDMPAVTSVLQEAPANLEVRMPGRVDNGHVRAHYGSEPVDAFLMLSEMEGLPVSIQEALAAGVPIVATAVGGIPEAVGDDDGVLLRADPTVDEVVAALERVLFEADPERAAARRRAARRRWERDFDAERNHAAFAAELRARVEALRPGARH
jgi:glycosyltransferase involved in cell wall biosynthesis